MGRNLALGIPTRIRVCKRKKYVDKDYKVLDNKDKFLNKLNNMVNINDYDIFIDEDDDSINLSIKEDFVNKNIHKCVIEIIDTTGIRGLVDPNLNDRYKLNLNKYNQKDFPMKLQYNEEIHDKFYDMNTYYMISEKSYNTDYTHLAAFKPYFPQEYWLLDFDKTLYKNVNVYIEYMPIWINVDKYNGDDEINIIYLLNKFSRNYFKNKLSNDLLFFIIG